MELLKILSNTPGVSGFEDRVQQVVVSELEGVCDEVQIDRIGNVIGIKRATRIAMGATPPKIDARRTHGRDRLYGQAHRQGGLCPLYAHWWF